MSLAVVGALESVRPPSSRSTLPVETWMRVVGSTKIGSVPKVSLPVLSAWSISYHSDQEPSGFCERT